MTRRRPFLLTGAALAALVSLGSGCVSLQEHEEMKKKLRDTAWTLERADQANASKDQKLLLLENQIGVKDGELSILRQKLGRAEDALRNARSEIDEAFAQNIQSLGQDMAMEISPYGGLILENSILFNSGKWALRDEGKAMLKTLVSRLLAEEYSHTDIEIAGHTDADPIKHAAKSGVRNNWDLSAKRALTVLESLISMGVPRDRIFLAGYGYGRPISSDSSSAGKARNRRVEVRLHERGGSGG